MASPNNTIYVAGAATITDAAGNNWWINGGQVEENGAIDAGTSNVQAIAYEDGVVWQMAIPSWSNGQALWWAKTGGPGSYDGWTSGPGTNNSNGTPHSPAAPSANGATISLVAGISPSGQEVGDESPLVDAQKNLWWISQQGQVVENGTPDAGTGNVLQMAYEGGFIWQEAQPSWSSVPLWWAKTGGAGNYDGWTSGPGTNNANGTQTAPVAEFRTWLGGGDNLASDPGDWSPYGAPQAGDSLTMPNGTINIVGDALKGDNLSLLGNGGEPFAAYTINMSGNVATNLNDEGTGYGLATINLAAGTIWTGSAPGSPYGKGSTIQGAGTWDNSGTLANNIVTVDVNVGGKGTFTAVGDHYQAPKLEFMHAVGPQQSVIVEGGNYGNEHGVVQIDDLSNFQAPIALGFGEVILKGLTASSYTYQNDMLTLFNGNTPVKGGTLNNLALKAQTGSVAPTDFGVSQIGGNIDIHASGSAYQSGGELLPLHT